MIAAVACAVTSPIGAPEAALGPARCLISITERRGDLTCNTRRFLPCVVDRRPMPLDDVRVAHCRSAMQREMAAGGFGSCRVARRVDIGVLDGFS